LSEKTFYITTPLYYVNDVPHVGHAYATIGADVLARFMRANGRKVFLMTGTDEHGQKIAKAAAEKGYADPKALADEVAPRFNELWKALDITHDRFFRTTDADHRVAAQAFFDKVRQAGYLEKRGYEGWYSVADETFWLESQLKQPGNLAPDSGQPCVKMKEENWFFLQSKLKDRLKAYLAAHPDFIQPDLRRNEVLGSYLNAEDGVHDTSVTRSTVKWGIPVPGDEGQVLYVWFDALINYLTGTGWPAENIDGRWPADVHIIGKDILRFHAVLWPSMLLAAGFTEDQLPRQVFGTGLILRDGVKMSKSLNNGVDPHEWIARYGGDVLRYYLMREVPFGQDGSISESTIEGRYNNDLANGLGNLLSRTSAIFDKSQVAFAHWQGPGESPDSGLLDVAEAFGPKYLEAMKRLAFHEALEAVNELVRAANKYVDEKAPWTLAKDRSEQGQFALAHTLYCIAEAVRISAVALAPFMPSKADKILQQLSFESWSVLGQRGEALGKPLEKLLEWGGLPSSSKLIKGEPLFPRIETASVVAKRKVTIKLGDIV
jgi:methionyl-tRNA synthetase